MFLALSLLAVVLTLLLVVGFHEAGHALSARLFGIRIKRISIGFGKPLLAWRDKNKIQWVWALWPLGGYVRLFNSRVDRVREQQYQYCFDKKPVWQRIIVLISGGIFNFFLAWFVFAVVYKIGFPQVKPVIASVSAYSVAAKAGLKPGERFVRVAGNDVDSWRDVAMQFIMNMSKERVNAVVVNDIGMSRKVAMNLSNWRYQDDDTNFLISLGFYPKASSSEPVYAQAEGVISAFQHAFSYILTLCLFFLILIKQLVLGVIPFSVLLGPIGLIVETVSSFYLGVVQFLFFVATLSIAVGLINFFPIPGLDGGSVLYALLEKARGKPISVPLEILLQRLALIAFCVLLVNLILNDLTRYFS